jgi:hypothetical protein
VSGFISFTTFVAVAGQWQFGPQAWPDMDFSRPAEGPLGLATACTIVTES